MCVCKSFINKFVCLFVYNFFFVKIFLSPKNFFTKKKIFFFLLEMFWNVPKKIFRGGNILGEGGVCVSYSKKNPIVSIDILVEIEFFFRMSDRGFFYQSDLQIPPPPSKYSHPWKFFWVRFRTFPTKKNFFFLVKKFFGLRKIFTKKKFFFFDIPELNIT